MPAKFGVHFLPLTKNVPKQTKLHLNEIGLNNTEFCKSQGQLRQPLISWKIRYFSTFSGMGKFLIDQEFLIQDSQIHP